ncbi:MAG: PAC2 family protein [Candidatus Thermoplasmatota archaeon]|nr:PAC2 family protein [Candidatus Thermoplasmatota archaeon]
MEDIKFLEYKDVDLSDSLLIVAFPTVGLVSSIAGHFIIDQLKLEPIGAIISSKFMPATVIHKGLPAPPVRIYAGKKRCGPDDSCKRLAIIISEFMPQMETIKPLADEIFSWAENKGCKIILSLEGMHAIRSGKDKKPKVFGVASTLEMNKELKKYKIDITQEGMITGVTGVLLYMGHLFQKDVICLLAETELNYPDSHAAALLVEKLDKMLPEIKIDPKPLYKAAKEIEDQIRMAMQQAKPTAPSIPPLPTQMYG